MMSARTPCRHMILMLMALSLPMAAKQHSFAQSSGADLWLRPARLSDQAFPRSAGDAGRLNDSIGSVTGCVVRVAYVIPYNRQAQSNAVENLRWTVRRCREWYDDQMARHGFPGRQPRFEMEADGVTPKIHLVSVDRTDAELRVDLWGKTLDAAGVAGVPVWTSKQVWLLVSEAHMETADGGITGGTALGASLGSGDDPGVGMLGGDSLARLSAPFLTNDAAYSGQIVPALGPYPLVQSVSFPWFEGNTFSSIASSVLGACIHELSHAFGLPHDFRNDQNFAGNLMGNGLRGVRGNFYPARYASDYTRISYGSALALSVSRYFNPPRTYPDNTRPSVTITTPAGTNAPVNGAITIDFSASDAGGLHAAWLQLNGDLVAEMPLSGISTNARFSTPLYNPGQGNTFTVSVFDRQGNKQSIDVQLTPDPVTNRAPQPFVTVSSPSVFVGQTVTLNASQSSDPAPGASALRVEWDLDGDGTFDTPPSPGKTLSRSFPEPGDRMISVRLTDAQGAASVSAPLALRVEVPSLSVTRVASVLELSWPSGAAGWVLESARADTTLEWAVDSTPVVLKQDRFVAVVTPSTGEMGAVFFRLRK